MIYNNYMEELQKEIAKLKKKNTVLQGIITDLRNKKTEKTEISELSHIRKKGFETGKTPPTPVMIIIDNFYNNPLQTRKHILKQEFKVRGNYPGQRTVSFATPQIRDLIQKWIEPYGGKITQFPMEKDSYNGAFQYTTSRDRSWFHVDSWNNWAGVLYMILMLQLMEELDYIDIKMELDLNGNKKQEIIKKKWMLHLRMYLNGN